MRRLALAVLLALAAPALAEVKVGDAAPDFTLKDQDGAPVSLASFKGKRNVLLAFYVHDFTGGCTTELKCLVKDTKKLAARDFAVLAISVDPVEKHAEFAKTIGAQFKLLSDPDLAVAKLYDVAAPSADGGTAVRSAFIVDKEGKLRWLDREFKTPVGPNGDAELLAQVEKVGGRPDPVAALADLPPLEREGKTVFVRFAQALLAEDLNALDALLDPDACGKPGEPAQMQRERRKALLERWRVLFDKQDLKALKFDEVVDVRATRVLAKDAATPEAATAFGADARAAVGRLADGEVLVVGRTSGPKIGDVEVLAREVVLRLKKTGDAWRIVDVAP
jgi:peroxiredoxin